MMTKTMRMMTKTTMSKQKPDVEESRFLGGKHIFYFRCHEPWQPPAYCRHVIFLTIVFSLVKKQSITQDKNSNINILMPRKFK